MINKQIIIWAFYPVGAKLTGQELASRLIVDTLKKETHYRFNNIQIPTFSKSVFSSINNLFRFTSRLFNVCLKMLFACLSRKDVIYLNLGQSINKMIIVGLPFYAFSHLFKFNRSVISLHGNLFISWKLKSIKTTLYRMILDCGTKITALSVPQRRHLIEMGIEPNKIALINNTCENIFERKPANDFTNSEDIKILFLSNLIEEKGFLRFLRALRILAKLKVPVKFEAILCGDFVGDIKQNKYYNDTRNKYMNNLLKEINKSNRVQVKWIKGAYNEEKYALYKQTDIFVFPSYYRIEAQPIVLIEAMASACAIISSNVGDIPRMLKDGAGLCLHDCTPVNLAFNIYKLIENPNDLAALKKNAKSRYNLRYSRLVYKRNWVRLFSDVSTQ